MKYADKFCLNCNNLLEKKGGKLYENRKYCSKFCKYDYEHKKGLHLCLECGIEFYRSGGYDIKFCSKQCGGLHKTKTNSEISKCVGCGSDVKVRRNRWYINNHFCSKKCFNNHISHTPLNSVEKIKKICSICNNTFEIYPSNEKQSKNRGHDILYCSISCRNKDKDRMTEKSIIMNKIQSDSKGLNKIECMVKDILDNLGLKEDIDYFPQYKMFNKFLVDFFIEKENIVIQCDGDYWHGHESMLKDGLPDKRQLSRMTFDKSQDAYMNKCGVTILRFWEHEILKEKEKIDGIIKRAISKTA